MKKKKYVKELTKVCQPNGLIFLTFLLLSMSISNATRGLQQVRETC